MKNICKIFKIIQLKSTVFHPQCLGTLERSHHILVEYLKQFSNKHNWDVWLRFTISSYNTSFHEATGFSPHKPLFVKDAVIPSEFSNNKVTPTFNNFLDDMLARLKETQSTVRKRLIEAKEISKKYYDLKCSPKNFKVGDLVNLVKKPQDKKLDYQYVGPYEIIKLKSDTDAEILLRQGKTKVVHLNELSLAFIRAETDRLHTDEKSSVNFAFCFHIKGEQEMDKYIPIFFL